MEVREYIQNSIDVKRNILNNEKFISDVEEIINVIIAAFQTNKKILIMGNGGSASDSNHIAAEFVSKFQFHRPALAAVSLTSNSSILTGIGNDYSFKEIFSRQIEALGNEGDILIGISTSGKSENIIEGFKKAQEKKLTAIFLTSENAEYKADYTIKVPSKTTSLIQEVHITLAHIICAKVEEALYKKV